MRALVLSGGGTHGAYQVGVLKHLMGDLKTEYDILAGVSVGAINVASLAQYKTGEEQEAIRTTEELWLGIDNSSIWSYFFPPFLSALWKSGIYSTNPLRKLLEKNFNYQKVLDSGKLLRVPAVSLNTGKWEVWTEHDKDMLDGIMASMAFPGVFETPKIRNQVWIDGGVRTVTPLKEAIDAGADEIDVILTFKPGTGKINGGFTTIKVLKRALNIMMDEVVVNDLRVCKLKNNIDSYRKIKLSIYSPSIGLKGGALDFDPKNIRDEIELGYGDATEY